jgi:ketosteroid isomerase-like protein
VELVHRYFELAAKADVDAYLPQFTEDALVEDEGRERRGVAAIREWRREVVPVTYTVRDVRSDGDGHDARVDIAGDFPGSPVRLTFHFQFTPEGRIAVLRIRG